MYLNTSVIFSIRKDQYFGQNQKKEREDQHLLTKVK